MGGWVDILGLQGGEAGCCVRQDLFFFIGGFVGGGGGHGGGNIRYSGYICVWFEW